MTPANFSLDTSFVLRLLVARPLDQFYVASRFLQEQRTAQGSLHVSDLVLAEVYFALQSFYQMPKADALTAIATFIQHSGVTTTPVARTVLALPNLASTKPGFVDRLIHGSSHAAGHTFVTFEKAAKKFPATVVLATS